MTWIDVRRCAGVLFFVMLGTAAFGAETFDRPAAHFTNLYGLPESTTEVKSHAFFHGAAGMTTLEGEFSVRVHRQRDLQVEVVCTRPELRLAAVTFRRERAWTPAELESILAAFGPRWKELAPYSFVSSEGTRATYVSGTLYFVSNLTLGAIEQQERREAEKKH